MIDIGALVHCGVIGEELDRDRVQQGRDERDALRHRDAEGAAPFEPGDAGGIGDHHHPAAARDDLLDIRQGLVEEAVGRRHDDDRHIVVNASSAASIVPRPAARS